MGIYMLPAFILGFWCIWSGSRDVKSLWEAFSMTIIVIIIKISFVLF